MIEVTGSEEDSLRMLESGALDAYVTVDSFAANPAVEPKQPIPVCKIGSSDFYFAVSAARPDLLPELENAMSRILEENPYYSQELAEKHLVTAGNNAFLTPGETAWLEKHGTIRVGYQDNYLAFCATNPETGELIGALSDYLDIAKERLRNTELHFEPQGYPTAQAAIEALKRGEIDCMFPANLGAGDGEALGLFMTPSMMRTDIFAIVRQADCHVFGDREHVIVAVNEGNPNYDSCLLDDFPGWHTVYYPTTAECLKAVSQGVADCVLISSYRYNNIARQCEKERLAAVATGRELDYCFAVAAGHPELYSILSRVADLVPEAAVNTALSRYVAEDSKVSVADFVSDHIIAIAAITGAVLLIILALLIRSRRAEKKAARLISATETDELTGLYNRDYFLEYAGRLRREHPEKHPDAIVLNIIRFHAVNALNGRAFGDRVLRALGHEINAVAKEADGIAGRFEADRFDMFLPHREDYQALYERLPCCLEALAPGMGLRLRMGVMPWEEGLDAVQLFDRARTACSMARDNPGRHLIISDAAMREQENFEQRLLRDLSRALTSYEFEVHYQPLFDIRQDPPRPVSAEALVRWNHPELGLIPPAEFVPVLERNGKIPEVDRYVWSEAARQVARWRDGCGVSFPVSVNLSRVDLSDPTLESTLDRLRGINGLSPDLLRLEVTESAYTGNAEEVTRVVERLRGKGYIVEMDDFGTGYSSLNMLSAMPVDVLKMDRAFLRKLGEDEKSRQMVALILDLARSLQVSVVAEGVETAAQLRLLREMGCPLVQGFFFSHPLPVEEFEETVIRALQKDRQTPTP